MIIEASEFKLLYKDNDQHYMNCETYSSKNEASGRYLILIQDYDYVELIEEVKSVHSLMVKGNSLCCR